MSTSLRQPLPELAVRGVGISPGIAVGTVAQINPQGYKVTLAEIENTQIAREVRRLRRAVKFTQQQLTALKGRLERELGTAHSVILDAQLLMLADRLFFQQIETRIATQLVNAEWAIQQELSRLLNSYHQVSDGYLQQRMSDIEDVANRLVATLSGRRHKPHRLQVGTVVVAESIPASRLAELDIDHVAAFITTAGGWASHAAIIARSLAIPAVAGVDSLKERFTPHQRAIIDGSEGLVIINPTDATLHHYRMLQERRKRSFHALVEQSRGPTYTEDNQEVTLQANIDLVSELQAATRFGAQGIGLFRSEFIFTNMLPQAYSEEGQLQIYQQLAEATPGSAVTIRTFDMSEDKIPFLKVEAEGNPALGLRGIRLALKNENLFRTQIRAIIRASTRQNIHILLPLISCISELRRARQIILEESASIASQINTTLPTIPLGVMIEVPAAVMMVEQLAAEADFLSVGTNDLIQYLLAVDRNNKQVSYLYQPLHPAVLQAINRVIEVATQQQKPLSICGEMAADPMYAAILVGMGIRKLSMTPTAIPLVKEAIKAIDTQVVNQLVHEALSQVTASAIEQFLCEKLTEHFPVFYASLRWHTHRWGKEKVH